MAQGFNRLVKEIYNIRNYLGLIDREPYTSRARIYNSRNYLGLIDARQFVQETQSTTVEII